MFRFHCSLNSDHIDFETSGAKLISLADMNRVKARYAKFADKTYLDCSTGPVLRNYWRMEIMNLSKILLKIFDPLRSFKILKDL